MEDNHKKTPKRCRSSYRQVAGFTLPANNSSITTSQTRTAPFPATLMISMGGKVVSGTSNRFVLYLGSSVKSAVKTDWVYTSMLLFIILRSCGFYDFIIGVCGFEVSLTEEIAFLRMLSSCAEECISAVHNNGTQHDGFLTPDIAEAEVHNDCSVDMKNDLSRYSLRLGREFNG
ncbi:hypothetical protein POTOM_008103 [Populus tomentosa]|uniref:Uncharacterized protein n=1 Tax=Populus tomentosa TaxID=118781 RepID=A0A8X8DDW6_POPTO|nr:hypothetical protein POTOM_008103 [Populus tomentosa]